MLPNYFDCMFVLLRQKSTSQARIEPEILSTLGLTKKAQAELTTLGGGAPALDNFALFLQKKFMIIMIKYIL